MTPPANSCPRHVERARVLAILLDLSPYDEQEVNTQLEILLNELKTYKPELLDRPRLLISSKADVATQDPLEGSLKISSVTGEGVQELKYKLELLVKEVVRGVGVADKARRRHHRAEDRLVSLFGPCKVVGVRDRSVRYVIQGIALSLRLRAVGEAT